MPRLRLRREAPLVAEAPHLLSDELQVGGLRHGLDLAASGSSVSPVGSVGAGIAGGPTARPDQGAPAGIAAVATVPTRTPRSRFAGDVEADALDALVALRDVAVHVVRDDEEHEHVPAVATVTSASTGPAWASVATVVAVGAVPASASVPAALSAPALAAVGFDDHVAARGHVREVEQDIQGVRSVLPGLSRTSAAA